jgi:HSP90 family molecular chaperone
LEDIYSKIQKNEDASNAIYNLFDIACIEAGDVLRKPSNFAKRIVEMMAK